MPIRPSPNVRFPPIAVIPKNAVLQPPIYAMAAALFEIVS